MILNIVPITAETAEAIRAGGPDAAGRTAARMVSTGAGFPCRLCLRNIGEGEGALLFSYAPNPPGPFWEAGPVFIHEAACRRRRCNGRLPTVARGGARTIRAYDADHRIVYAENRLVDDPAALEMELRGALIHPDVAYVHVRNSRAGCFSFQVERA